MKRPSCSSCIRAKETCAGYRDTETVRINDQTDFVRSKMLAKAAATQGKQSNASITFQHLPQDLLVLGREMFFAHYVSDFCQTWNFLCRYLKSRSAPQHLSLGIDAVSLAFLSHQVSSPTAKDLGRRKYCEALRKMNKALQNPETARVASTLETALLLDLFEKIAKSTTDINVSRHAHVDGALALVKLRGIKQFQEVTELKALMGLSLNAIICSLSTGRPIPIEVRKIRKHAARFIDTSSPKWRLSGLMLEVTDLAAEMRSGTITLEDRIAKSVEFDQQLEVVALEACPVWSYERRFISEQDARSIVPEGFSPVYDIYPNREITQMWNVLRLIRILLCEEVVGSCSTLQDTESEAHMRRAKLIIVEMVQEICASVPQMTNCDFAARQKLPDQAIPSAGSQHTHTMSHILDVYILVFGLYIVAWSQNCPSPAREWTMKQLHHIADHFGIHEAAIMLDILKKQEDEACVDPQYVHSFHWSVWSLHRSQSTSPISLSSTV